MNDLRPKTFEDYIGQNDIKNLLRIACSTAKKRNEPLDHVLLHGFPGLGKTTLALAIANELGVNIRVVEAPHIKKVDDLSDLLTDLNEGDILFIDEIHNLSKTVEESLYSALEDREAIITVKKNLVRIKIQPFTLIGATTRLDLLSQPLRDRFGLVCHLQYYSVTELMTIIKNASRILGIGITKEAAEMIAVCSRGTARVTNQILKRCRDIAQFKSKPITRFVVKETLSMLKIEENGLTEVDKKIITILKGCHNAVGLNSLASLVGVNTESLLTVYEPYLINQGILVVTQKGRMLANHLVN